MEARVLAVLEATLAVRLALGALVHALAVILHVALAGSTLGAGGSARGCALHGLLSAGRLLVGISRLGLRIAFGAGRRLDSLLRLVLGLLLRLLILLLLILRLLLLLGLGLGLLVVLLMVLVVAVVRIAVGRGPKEVGADRGDGKSRDEPVTIG